jgi:mono/diheme cytochrome c family protein
MHNLEKKGFAGSLAALVFVTLFSSGCMRNDGADDAVFTARWNQTLVMPAGIPAEELPEPGSEGARLVAKYCSQCHGIPSPARHSAEEWVPTFRRMVRRMEHSSRMGRMMGGRWMRGPRGMHGAAAPTVAERRVMLAYLQANALQPLDELPPEAAEAPGAAAFSETCARCHALPSPDQHTAGEWPAVVDRMRRHMAEMDVSDPGDETIREIIDFLQNHAR